MRPSYCFCLIDNRHRHTGALLTIGVGILLFTVIFVAALDAYAKYAHP